MKDTGRGPPGTIPVYSEGLDFLHSLFAFTGRIILLTWVVEGQNQEAIVFLSRVVRADSDEQLRPIRPD